MTAIGAGRSVTLVIEAKLENRNQLAFKTLSDNSSRIWLTPTWDMKHFVLDKILEKEQITLTEPPGKYDYNRKNYTFDTPIDLGGVWKVPIQAKNRDGDFYIDGWLLVLPDGELVQSDGVLVKSPDSKVTNARINVKFQEFNGIRLPTNYNSSGDVWLVGHSTLETKFHYKSVNGVAISEVSK